MNGTTEEFDFVGENAYTVITSAITSSRGGLIHIKNGSYAITTRINIQHLNGLILEGEGWDTVLKAFSPNQIIRLTNCSNVTIKNLQLDGQRTSTAVSGGGLLDLLRCSNATIAKVYAHSARTHGIEVTKSVSVTIEDCLTIDNGDDGISLDDGPYAPGGSNGASVSRDITIIGCESRDNVQDSSAGFEINDGVKRVTFIECVATGNNRGFDIHTHLDNVAPANISYISCKATENFGSDAPRGGFVCWADTGAEIATNVVYTTCYSSDNSGYGFLIRHNQNSNLLSVNNTINESDITNNSVGIGLLGALSHTVIYGNNLANNKYGVMFDNPSNNKLYHNNFVNNTFQVSLSNSEANFWDDGYPSGGNYWSNYTGIDLYSGPFQNETGSDGIGDTPYIINEGNTDNYPLASPFGAPSDDAFSVWLTLWILAIPVTIAAVAAGILVYFTKVKINARAAFRSFFHKP